MDKGAFIRTRKTKFAELKTYDNYRRMHNLLEPAEVQKTLDDEVSYWWQKTSQIEMLPK